MITVLLYGFLAKKYGKKHVLDIRSAAEAVRALSVNYPDFKKEVVDSENEYRVLVGKEDRADELGLHLPATKTIKIVPLIVGSGGLGKILVGAALIYLSFQFPGFGAFSAFGQSFSLASIAGSIGFSLVLGGISGLLFAPPKQKNSSNEKPANQPSYTFNGAVNTTGQGNPVPVCYGRRLRVGSQVISAGLSAENL